MTEAEWLACHNHDQMLHCLVDRDGPRWPRKFRLFACACCRRLWHLLPEECRARVEAAEAFADGCITPGELSRAAGVQVAFWIDLEWLWRSALLEATRRTASQDSYRPAFFGAFTAAVVARECAVVVAQHRPEKVNTHRDRWANLLALRWSCAASVEREHQLALLLDIVGNPFRCRPVATAWLSWREATVPTIARAIYEVRRFEELPVLADALEEAGCTDSGLLAHLRGPGPHTRGCWALDLLLGKG